MVSRLFTRLKQYGPDIVLEALEDRIVLNATVDQPATETTTPAVAPDQSQSGQQADPGAATQGAADTSPQTEITQPLQVILVTNELGQVFQDAASSNTKVVTYDSAADDLEDLNQKLSLLVEQSGAKIGTLAVIGHGSDGVIEFGSDEVTIHNVEKFAPGLSTLATLLTEDAQIQFYACAVGASDAGKGLARTIASFTQADVFVSDDNTGGSLGDWSLEFAVNASTSISSIFNETALAATGIDLSFPTRPPLDNSATYTEITGSLASSDGSSVMRSGRYSDEWSFTLTQETLVSLGLQTTVPGNSGSSAYADLFLILYSGSTPNSANFIYENDDYGEGTNAPYVDHYDASIQMTLQPGTYVVELTTYGSADTGNYKFIYAFSAPAVYELEFPGKAPLDNSDNYVETRGQLEYGDGNSAARGTNYFADVYTFTLTQNAYVSIGAQTLFDGALDAYLILYSGATPNSANVLAQNDNWNTVSVGTAYYQDALIQTLLGPGTYSVEVTSNSTQDVGEYLYAHVIENVTPPTASGADIWVAADTTTPVTFKVYGTDSNIPSWYQTAFLLTSSAQYGTVTAVGNPVDEGSGVYSQTFSYLPRPGQWGDDSFTFVMETLQNGWKGFTTTSQTVGSKPATSDTYDIAFVDINGDGWLDMVTAESETNTARRKDLYFLWNSSTNSFQAGVVFSSSDNLNGLSIAAADLDQDGDGDVVIRQADGATVYYLWNSSTSSFGAQQTLSGEPATKTGGAVAIGDVNNDGWNDIVVGYGANGVQDYVFLNTKTAGAASFGAGAAIGAAGNTGITSAIGIADFNNDGWNDIVVGKQNNTTYPDLIYYNNGSGSFPVSLKFSLPSTGIANYLYGLTNDLAVGDVDADGDMDIVMANGGTNDGSLEVLYRNDGPAAKTWTLSTMSTDKLESKNIQLADVDRDGDLDAIVTNNVTSNSGEVLIYFFDNSAGVKKFTGAGQNITSTSTNISAWGGGVADVDRDGDIDYVAGIVNGADLLFRNNGFNWTTASNTATATIHVGLIKNWSFDQGLNHWDYYEERVSDPLGQEVGIFTILPSGTTINPFDTVHDLLDGNEQMWYKIDGLSYTINGGDDDVALHLTNAPHHAWLTQTINKIPTDASVKTLELQWDMAYWNHYDPASGYPEFVPGYHDIAVYVYAESQGLSNPAPVWVTTVGVDALQVDSMTTYSVTLPLSLLGQSNVRVVIEMSALPIGWFEVALDNFRIVPTRSGSTTNPSTLPVFDLGPVDPSNVFHLFDAGGTLLTVPIGSPSALEAIVVAMSADTTMFMESTGGIVSGDTTTGTTFLSVAAPLGTTDGAGIGLTSETLAISTMFETVAASSETATTTTTSTTTTSAPVVLENADTSAPITSDTVATGVVGDGPTSQTAIAAVFDPDSLSTYDVMMGVALPDRIFDPAHAFQIRSGQAMVYDMDSLSMSRVFA